MAKANRQPRRPTNAETGGWTAWTQARQDKIVALIRGGSFAKIAARAAGLDYDTFNRWMRLGQDKTELDPETGDSRIVEFAPEPFRGFRGAVEAADAELESEAANIAYVGARAQASPNAQSPNPVGMLNFMGRRYRKRWAAKADVEISGPNGGPVEVNHGDDAERLAAVLGALARAGVHPGAPEPGRSGGAAEEPEAEAD